MSTLVEGFRHRAGRKLREAKEYLKQYNHAESVSASQECMELSAKAAFLMLQVKYPKRHEFKDEEFEELLARVPEEAKYHNFSKLFFNYRFWQEFYIVAKYGNERLNVAAEQLFEKEEAELALKHAHRWNDAVSKLWELREQHKL